MRFATASSGGRSSLLLLLLSGAFVAVSGLAAEQASSYAPRHRDDRPRYGAQEDLLRPKSPPMSDVLPDYTLIRNPDAWRSQERRNYHDMIARMAKHVDRNPADKLTPALEELKILIETNPRIYMYFVQMFDEIPHRFPYNSDGVGKPVLRDYRHMLQVLNHIVTRGPDVDTVGVPMVIILAYPMGTASGHAAFLDPTVNKAFKKVLREWGHFLLSPASCDVLGTSDSGWFGKQKLHELEQAANAPYHTHKTFEQLFECDPSAESHGYKSWDDFFTRRFRPGIRPVAHAEDDNVVANACESKAYNVQRGVQLRDNFFIKGQPYSVLDMLAHDPVAEQFVGGTVYQAFLSPLSYHRWHAPVSGTVRRAYLVDGTYFSVPLFQGVGDHGRDDINPKSLDASQAYLSALAARAVIVIEADNPALGLVAFIGVGMDEVSSCEIEVREGQHVRKGQEMGMFHFGGSSYCALFQGGVDLDGFPDVGNATAANVPLRSKLAVVTGSRLGRQAGGGGGGGGRRAGGHYGGESGSHRGGRGGDYAAY